MTKIACPACILSLCALLVACGNPNQRLDEFVFYDGPQFRLKVVRFYRNIPFNQLGEQAVVMCQSDNTMESSGLDEQDAGWRMLGAGGEQDSNSARDVALRVQGDYQVLDDDTLVAITNAFNISFDACGHFINWDPSRLPNDMIAPLEKPDSCAPGGPADCSHYDFEGDRAPRYEQIYVPGKGRVSFTARSQAFRGAEWLRIETRNNGAVWHVDIVHPAADGQTLAPDNIRSLSVASLDKGLDDVSLADWFESVLPADSMVIWPDSPAGCGTRPGPDEDTFSAQCVEIRFNHTDGNSGTLYIAINSGQENRPLEASFHSATYVSGDRTRAVESLTGLREELAAGTE